ncbi:MAG: amino acid transporter, partial [Pseudanabaena sp.]
WQGKLLVLCLLGFVATDFIITITLSAADATAHIVENPLVPAFFHGQLVPITLVLIALLGAIFLKGFREAIGIAVILVAVYLFLNLITVSVGLQHIFSQPTVISNWQNAIFANNQNPLILLGISVLVFPKLALGLSGFETGVAVMPLVKGLSDDSEQTPKGRIKNTHKMLASAAWIMSFFLLTSSIVTTLLIPAAEFGTGGKANGRALAFLAHQFFGDIFGTVYDLSTIS